MRGFIQLRFVLGAGAWLSFGDGTGAGGAISLGN
jgi:hypothetical protein